MATGADIQNRLNALGAKPPLVADGILGPASTAAIIAFQKSKGLAPDGKAGPLTLAALGLAAAPISTPPATAVSLPPAADVPAGELPNKITPLSPTQAAQAISDGYLIVTGKRPSKVILGLLIGQSALETGNWQSIHWYNFGNKKYSKGDRNWQFFRCSEIVNGKEVFYDPPAPECKFAAYPSPAQGAAAFIRLLASRAHWWQGLQSGTVAGFIKGLTTKPMYFTANPAQYQKVLADRMQNFATLAEQYAGKAAGVGVLVLLAGLGFFAVRFLRRF